MNHPNDGFIFSTARRKPGLLFGSAHQDLLAVVIRSAQPASVLAVDDAIALALKGNREVQSASLELDGAREETAALRTKRLPQFRFTHWAACL